MMNLLRKRKSERRALRSKDWPHDGLTLWTQELSPTNIMVKRFCGLMEITRNDRRIRRLGALRVGLGHCPLFTCARPPPCRHRRHRRCRRPLMPVLLARGHGHLLREEVLAPLLLLILKPRGLDMKSQLDGRMHAMMRLHPAKWIGWRLKVEPPVLFNPDTMCRCKWCQRGFAPYAVRKVTLFQTDAPLPLLRRRVQTLHECDQRQARSLCHLPIGADRYSQL